MNKFVKLALSTGEPAGIGPEVSLTAAKAFVAAHSDVEISLFGDRQLFENEVLPPQIQISHIPLNHPPQPGVLDQTNAQYVLSVIRAASDSCRVGQHHALITAPVQKSILDTPQSPFTGHTEFLAELDQQPQVVMMLCGEIPQALTGKERAIPLRVALATTHLPITQVAGAIQFESLLNTLRIMQADLQVRFGISRPQIAVTGLNPHAGEDGHLGREELEVIIPVIEAAKQEGILAFGPYPADTLFHADRLHSFDAVLAMYHDQGLTPFKFASFAEGVNVTLGLSYIRTSVDHGTALDIAGQGKADWRSMFAALRLARELALTKLKNDASST
jgi:4-hydroxythreonine-4-phosphate dehydrogenase